MTFWGYSMSRDEVKIIDQEWGIQHPERLAVGGIGPKGLFRRRGGVAGVS